MRLPRDVSSVRLSKRLESASELPARIRSTRKATVQKLTKITEEKAVKK